MKLRDLAAVVVLLAVVLLSAAPVWAWWLWRNIETVTSIDKDGVIYWSRAVNGWSRITVYNSRPECMDAMDAVTLISPASGAMVKVGDRRNSFRCLPDNIDPTRLAPTP